MDLSTASAAWAARGSASATWLREAVPQKHKTLLNAHLARPAPDPRDFVSPGWEREGESRFGRLVRAHQAQVASALTAFGYPPAPARARKVPEVPEDRAPTPSECGFLRQSDLGLGPRAIGLEQNPRIAKLRTKCQLVNSAPFGKDADLPNVHSCSLVGEEDRQRLIALAGQYSSSLTLLQQNSEPAAVQVSPVDLELVYEVLTQDGDKCKASLLRGLHATAEAAKALKKKVVGGGVATQEDQEACLAMHQGLSGGKTTLLGKSARELFDIFHTLEADLKDPKAFLAGGAFRAANDLIGYIQLESRHEALCQTETMRGLHDGQAVELHKAKVLADEALRDVWGLLPTLWACIVASGLAASIVTAVVGKPPHAQFDTASALGELMKMATAIENQAVALRDTFLEIEKLEKAKGTPATTGSRQKLEEAFLRHDITLNCSAADVRDLAQLAQRHDSFRVYVAEALKKIRPRGQEGETVPAANTVVRLLWHAVAERGESHLRSMLLEWLQTHCPKSRQLMLEFFGVDEKTRLANLHAQAAKEIEKMVSVTNQAMEELQKVRLRDMFWAAAWIDEALHRASENYLLPPFKLVRYPNVGQTFFDFLPSFFPEGPLQMAQHPVVDVVRAHGGGGYEAVSTAISQGKSRLEGDPAFLREKGAVGRRAKPSAREAVIRLRIASLNLMEACVTILLLRDLDRRPTWPHELHHFPGLGKDAKETPEGAIVRGAGESLDRTEKIKQASEAAARGVRRRRQAFVLAAPLLPAVPLARRSYRARVSALTPREQAAHELLGVPSAGRRGPLWAHGSTDPSHTKLMGVIREALAVSAVARTPAPRIYPATPTTR